MKIIKATNRIYYLPGDDKTDRPYIYYILGRNYSVAVDAGYSKEHVDLFYEELEKLNLPLPRYTLITHWHWDHTFGLPYIEGQSIASEKTWNKLAEVCKWKWTEDAMKQREEEGLDIERCNENIKKVYPDLSKIKIKCPDKVINEDMILNLGDIHVELYPIDTIHSRDGLLIFVPEENALFVGDADCEDVYEGTGFVPEKVDAYIDFISKLDFNRYYVGHDAPDSKNGIIEYLSTIFDEEIIPEIRELTIKDIDEIKEVFVSIFCDDPWYDDWSDDAQLTAFINDLAGQNNSLSYGMFFDGELIGIALGHVRHWYSGTEYFLEEFGIIKDFRGEGYGSDFIEKIRVLLTKKNIHAIYLTTDKEIGPLLFYKKNGFAEETEPSAFYSTF